MLKKTIKYTDYNGTEREEDFYFNLTKAECYELQLSTEGGLEAMANRMIQAQNGEEIVRTFKDIVLMAYGEKSPDGRRFIKGDRLPDKLYGEIALAFSETPAYDQLFSELVTSDETMADFINGIIPQS